MARLPRLCLPGQLHHVLLRGNGGQQVCTDEEDRLLLRTLLGQHAPMHGLELHAWALMPDHIHLLLTPRPLERPGDVVVNAPGLSGFMQAIGRAYVLAFNRRHGRRGGLWEGRYRSTVLEAEPWLLRAMVWMDTHPLRSGYAAPGAALSHPWVSAAHYLGLVHDKLLTVPAQYWALANTPFAREAAYRTLLEHGSAPTHAAALAEASLKGWVLGCAGFVAGLQRNTARRLHKDHPGRPVGSGRVPS